MSERLPPRNSTDLAKIAAENAAQIRKERGLGTSREHATAQSLPGQHPDSPKTEEGPNEAVSVTSEQKPVSHWDSFWFTDRADV
ncbi:MAG: hypothetical protein WD992_00050 [Candidatus Levyibacteriota bacterium]